MNKLINNIYILVAGDTPTISNAQQGGINTKLMWTWISLIALSIILILIFRIKKKHSNLAFAELSKDKIQNSKSANINMDNLMDSINDSRDLYKELSSLCHPDRFINKSEQKIAEDLFQEITLHKRNYEKLVILKERAKVELNINL